MSLFQAEWVAEHCGPGPYTIIDAGTYNGTDALRLHAAYPSARVFAIEAGWENWMNTKNRLRDSNVSVCHFAVCDRTGIIEFNAAGTETKAGAGSIHRPRQCLMDLGFQPAPQDVPCTRLDDFCKCWRIAKIDLLHMDIQGAEYEALVGLGAVRPTLIFLEAGGGTINMYEGARKTAPLLADMGYKMLLDLGGDQLWKV